MEMSWKQGPFRTWIVASLIWFAGWRWYVWSTCQLIHRPGSPENEYQKMCYTNLSGWMTSVSDFALLDYASIVATGSAFPLPHWF